MAETDIGLVKGLIKKYGTAPDPSVIAGAVEDYLEAHPEATCPIDDTAGAGDTDKVLSADKVVEITDAISEAIAYKPGIESSSASGVDLDIADENGNVIVRLMDGEIKTKNFDSGVDCTEFINPYHDVIFDSDTVVKTTTHAHAGSQGELDVLLAKDLGAVALSNYYPSEPWYPLSEHSMSAGTGVTEIPNAEHHGFTGNVPAHLNAVGSTFKSGKPSGQTPIGVNDTWQHGIIKMKREMITEGGGGVTINHPVWTDLSLQLVKEMLDFDPIVLGIEIYNHDCEAANSKGWALDMWDDILKTGRRCWGFAVPDHYAQGNDGANWEGTISMFVPSNTQDDCLKAIQNGAFYIQQKHTTLALTGLDVSGHSVTVTVSESATIKTVIDGEVADTTTGATKTVNVPDNATYVRFEISTANDKIFTNPIMFKARKRFN